MASTNLSYSGSTTVVAASAYVTELSTSGTSRKVNLRLAVRSNDGYSGARNGSYSVTCSNSGTNTGTINCSISGSELDIFNQDITVTLNSDKTTANIDLSFSATIVSPSAGSKTISGTITQLTLSASTATYTITIVEGEGTSLVVKRLWDAAAGKGYTLADAPEMTNGQSVAANDVFVISYSAMTGYENAKLSFTNLNDSSGVNHIVIADDNVYVESSATLKSYILSVSKGSGLDLQVIRISTQSSSASTGLLTNGMTIYHFDWLEITYETDTGYEATVTINGTEISDGYVHEVSGAAKIVSTTAVKSYILTLNPDTGSTITVYRTNSPLQAAATGQLNDGATIYYNDVLQINFSSSAEYEIQSQLVNQVAFVSGGYHTVTSNVEVVTITGLFGVAYIYDGSTFSKYLIYIYDGSDWNQYIPYIYNGSSWDICS